MTKSKALENGENHGIILYKQRIYVSFPETAHDDPVSVLSPSSVIQIRIAVQWTLVYRPSLYISPAFLRIWL